MSNLTKTVLPISGMHCKSCALLIEDAIKNIPGVEKADVSFNKKEATVYANKELENEQFRSAVEGVGYSIGLEKNKTWINEDPKVYREIFEALIIAVLLYFAIAKTGFLNLNIGAVSDPSNLMVVLLVGVTAGLSTCMALVGGLVLGISARHAAKHPKAKALEKFRPHIFFNLGRIISYIILGGIIGSVGSVLHLSGVSLGLLIIFSGLVMLYLGLQLLDLFPVLSGGSFTIPTAISKYLGIKNVDKKEYSHLNSMLIGAATFFLPCGFTQAMQVLAISSGSFFSGALIMGTFAIGTAPGLLGVGGLTSVVKGNVAKKIFRFTGVVVIMLAIFNISNGYNLTGWNIFATGVSRQEGVKTPQDVKQGVVQEVNMTQLSYGYSPNVFTVKKGVPVRWTINATSPGACSSSIVIPSLGVSKILQPGRNVIEFTPTKVGNLRFSCSMGMYTGNFLVVE